MREIKMDKERKSGMTKEDVLKELYGAVVLYYGFRHASEKQEWFYAGEVKNMGHIAFRYFGVEKEEIDKVEQRVKERFDKIERMYKGDEKNE